MGAVALLGYAVKVWPDVMKDREARREEQRQLVRASTTTATVDDEGQTVQTVSQVSLQRLRVHPARVEVPFQPRDAADRARAVLADGQPLLLVGRSMAGKSRLGAELIKELYPDSPLWVFEPSKLPQFLTHGVLEQGSVVWLDDLERFLQVPDLRTDWVHVLTARGAVVVATMRATARTNFIGSGEVRHPQAAALEAFSEVEVRSADPAENARLSAAAATDEARRQIRRDGLGAFLGGGPVAVARYTDNQESHPSGTAFVAAAADWRRLGLPDPTTQTLMRIAAAYVPARLLHGPGREEPDAALAWAQERVEHLVQLLEPTGPDTYTCSDYILDHLTASNPIAQVPDLVWETAHQAVTTAAAHHTLGVAAYEADRTDDARRAFQTAASKPDDDSAAAARAAFNLGVLEAEHGNVDAARTAYRAAIDSAHPDNAPRAWVALGLLEAEHGTVDAARTAYQAVIDSAHPDHAPRAWAALGALEAEHGTVDAARTALRAAIDSAYPDHAPAAAVVLGLLEAEHGTVDDARTAFRAAIDSAHPDHAPPAWVALGLLEAKHGTVDAARAALRAAIDSAHPDHAPEAMFNLGVLEAKHGTVDAARTALQTAIDSAHPDHAPRAWVALGLLEAKHGTVDAARAALRAAIDSAHPDHAPQAWVVLGVLEAEHGTVDAARTAYQAAIDSAHPDHAPEAAVALGFLEAKHGTAKAARTALRVAIDSAHPDHAPPAWVALGLLEAEHGTVDAARTAYQAAIDSAHPHWSPKAIAALHDLGDPQ